MLYWWSSTRSIFGSIFLCFPQSHLVSKWWSLPNLVPLSYFEALFHLPFCSCVWPTIKWILLLRAFLCLRNIVYHMLSTVNWVYHMLLWVNWGSKWGCTIVFPQTQGLDPVFKFLEFGFWREISFFFIVLGFLLGGFRPSVINKVGTPWGFV